jgi:integrase/recombinase XerD
MLSGDISCPLLDQYCSYLSIIKGRSDNTIIEYKTDIRMFFRYLLEIRRINTSPIDASVLCTISISDMYSFINLSKKSISISAGTRARRIVSLRQFWKYLISKAHVLNHNVAEELETPKRPKRIPKYLSLEESMRLLMASQNNPRDHCVLTIFLNCALRLSELVNLDVDKIGQDVVNIIGKGNKERKIFLTPATQKALNRWLQIRKNINVDSNALFVSRNKQRITARAVQDIVKKYVIKAGLNPRFTSTHKLRHTAATLMYKYGHVDIRSLQLVLGHESIATTEIYTHIDEQQLSSAVNSNPLALMFN